MSHIRPIAIHLPQFHPFPENDFWWGKGFTEWSNVVTAKPLFKDHYQPHLPADLGFYDLRVPEVREEQAAMARSHGIYGFCFYHYWFNGNRLMHEPLDSMLKSQKPDFPFMYCWANENWTRRWDGEDNNTLIAQHYTTEDDRAHIAWLCECVFADPRYIRVYGKPFFAVYRPSLFPDIRHTVNIWREEAMKFGMELYLGYMQGFGFKTPPEEIGFDVAIDWQPDFYTQGIKGSAIDRLLDKSGVKPSVYRTHKISDYGAYIEEQKKIPPAAYKRYPAVTPMWDNTARRKSGAFILKDSTPEKYEAWLTHELSQFKPFSPEENFIFINAWNEWAEGNHLEPCRKWGRSYLEATKRAVDSNGS